MCIFLLLLRPRCGSPGLGLFVGGNVAVTISATLKCYRGDQCRVRHMFVQLAWILDVLRISFAARPLTPTIPPRMQQCVTYDTRCYYVAILFAERGESHVLDKSSADSFDFVICSSIAISTIVLRPETLARISIIYGVSLFV